MTPHPGGHVIESSTMSVATEKMTPRRSFRAMLGLGGRGSQMSTPQTERRSDESEMKRTKSFSFTRRTPSKANDTSATSAPILGRSIILYAGNGEVERLRNVLDKTKEAEEAIHHQDVSGDTALHHAALGGHAKCVDVLLQYGASVDARNANGELALHKAASIGSFPIVEMLISAGSPCSVVSATGWTAYDIARTRNHTECVRILTVADPTPRRQNERPGTKCPTPKKLEFDKPRDLSSVLEDLQCGKLEVGSYESNSVLDTGTTMSTPKSPTAQDSPDSATVEDVNVALKEWWHTGKTTSYNLARSNSNSTPRSAVSTRSGLSSYDRSVTEENIRLMQEVQEWKQRHEESEKAKELLEWQLKHQKEEMERMKQSLIWEKEQAEKQVGSANKQIQHMRNTLSEIEGTPRS